MARSPELTARGGRRPRTAADLRGIAVLAFITVVGCGGGRAPTPSITTPSAASTTIAAGTASLRPTPTAPPATVAPATTLGPTPTAPPALVGTWDGVHNCQRIIDALHDADLDSQILPNIVDNGLLPGVSSVADIADPDDPCAGAIDLAHAHVFTASGLFASLDQHDNQVDDGRWKIIDARTLTINGISFDFTITGNELLLEPITVDECLDPTQWCVEAWKVMVAMPGMAWVRRE